MEGKDSHIHSHTLLPPEATPLSTTAATAECFQSEATFTFTLKANQEVCPRMVTGHFFELAASLRVCVSWPRDSSTQRHVDNTAGIKRRSERPTNTHTHTQSQTHTHTHSQRLGLEASPRKLEGVRSTGGAADSLCCTFSHSLSVFVVNVGLLCV